MEQQGAAQLPGSTAAAAEQQQQLADEDDLDMQTGGQQQAGGEAGGDGLHSDDADDAADDDGGDDGDESDELYNQQNFGIYQALPVADGEPDWSMGEPDSAEEYLRRVRYEAARCPKVVRVEPASGWGGVSARALAVPTPCAISDAPGWAKPNRQWVAQFASDFQALRLTLQDCYEQGAYPAVPVPHLNDVDGWERACFGASAQAEAQQLGPADGAEMTQLTHGICSKLMALSQPEVVRLFLRHVGALEEACPNGLPLLRGQWLFALAARLEKPLHPEVGAALRAVLRHCCKLRSGVAGAADPLLPLLNVLIVTAGAYFGQDEQLCSYVDALELL